MAVAVVAALVSSEIPNTGTGEQTTSFAAGSSDQIVCFSGWAHSSNSRTATQTWNGVALLSVGTASYTSAKYTGIQIGVWDTAVQGAYPSGTHNMGTTMSANTDNMFQGIISVSGAAATQTFTGSDSNFAQGSPAGAGHTPQPSATVTGVTDGLIFGMGVADESVSGTLTSSDTAQFNASGTTNLNLRVVAVSATTVGSKTLNWSGVSNFFGWAAGALRISPAAAASASSGLLIGM